MDTNETPEIKHRSRRKPWERRRRRMILMVVALFVAPALFFGTMHFFAQKRIEAHLDIIRAKGYPATAEELKHWKVPVPPAMQKAGVAASEAPEASGGPAEAPEADGRTATGLYLDAMDLLEKRPGGYKSSDLPKELLEHFRETGTLTPEEMAQLRAYVEAGADVLALLHDAAGLAPGRIPLDYSKGWELDLSHLTKIREFSRLLRAETLLAAIEGDPDRAYEAVMAGLAVHRPLQQEPILISQLVRVACNSITLEALNDTLGRAAYSDEQLARIQQSFESSYDPAAMTNALVTERIFGNQIYDDPGPALASAGSGTFFLDNFVPGSRAALMQAAAAVGWYDGDRERYLSIMDEMLEASSLPYPEAQEAMLRLDDRIGTPTPLSLPRLSQVILPGLTHAQQAMVRNEAQLTEGATAAAIERYRLANGVPPAQLDDLVPAYLDDTPADPFDLEPLRYRREGDSYVLYSIGENGVDDGGTTAENRREGDLVFRSRP